MFLLALLTYIDHHNRK
nr:hypothetical protein [Lactobacillus taiwanensis]